MSDQFYTHRFQGTGVHMVVNVTAQAAQFILTRDVDDGPVEGLALTLDRSALDQLRLWLGMASRNTETPAAFPARRPAEESAEDTVKKIVQHMAAEQALSDVEQEAKVR